MKDPPFPAALPDPFRVLHVTTSTDVGGAERMLRRTLRALAVRREPPRVQSRVICLKPLGALGERLLEEGHDVVSLGASRTVLAEVRTLFRLRAALRAFRPHLVQTWLFRAGLLARLAGRPAGVPLLASVRTLEQEKTWQPFLDGLTAAGADHWLAVSEAAAEYHSRQTGIERRRYTVVPNAIEREEAAPPPSALSFRMRHEIPSGAFLVSSAGRLRWEKGHADLLRALALLPAGDRPLHAVLVGNGPEEGALRRLAESSGLGPRVRFVPHLDDPREAITASDLFCLPSLWEGMPGALLEAMALAIPCVATEVGGVPEVARHGIDALLTPPGSPERLAEALGRLRADAGLRSRLAGAGRARVLQEFTMDRHLARILALWGRLVASCAAP